MGLIFKKSTAQPAFTVAAAITGTTEATQTLTCAYTVVRARAVNVTVRWYRHAPDGEGINPTGTLLGTGTTYTLTGTDVGNYIRAIVTAINPAGTVQSTTSYTAIITSGDPPTPPTIASSAVITGTADVDETLTVTADFNGETSVTYQWYSYTTEPTGSPLAGDSEVELGTASTQPLTASEAGRWIVAVVTATNAAGSAVTSASVAMAGVDAWTPVLPTEYTPPAYDTSGMTLVYCNAGDDLQAKLNNLTPGQCLVVEAGATWTGNYYFRADNADGSDWIYVISSAVAGLPADGGRVSASDAQYMPKIQCGTYVEGGKTQSFNSVNNNATFKVYVGVKKLRLVGLEITTSYTDRNNKEYHHLAVGNYGTWSGVVGDEVVIDRCYVHGNETSRSQDGINLYWGVKNVAVIGCRVENYQGVGDESHAIHVVNGPGPRLIENCYLSAASIPMFVMDTPFTQEWDRVTDMVIRGNHIYKPLRYKQTDPAYDGFLVSVKNHFEIKGGNKILVEGNLLENSWDGGDQSGQWMNINAIGGKDVYDVTFRNNLIVDCNNCNVSAQDGGTVVRVKISNNLFYRMPGYGVPGYENQTLQWLMPSVCQYLTVENNTTWYPGGSKYSGVLSFNGTQPNLIAGMRFRNNVVQQSTYGIIGTDRLGKNAVTYFVDDNYEFLNNVAIYGSGGSTYFTFPSGQESGKWDNWYFPASVEAVGFTAIPFVSVGSFELSGGSAYATSGTGGSKPGIDASAITSALNDNFPS